MDREKLLRELRIFSGIVLLLAITSQVIFLPKKTTPALDKVLTSADATIKHSGEVAKKMGDLVDMLSKDYYDADDPKSGFYTEVRSTLAESRQSSENMRKFIRDLDASLNGGRNSEGEQVRGILPEVTFLIQTLTQAVSSLKQDLSGLKVGANSVLVPLATALNHVDELVIDLDKQVKAGGNVDKILIELALATEDLDKQLRNPDVAKTMSNVEKITGSLAETSESLDTVTRPWRKKVNQLQLILKTLSNFLKVVIPLPF